MFAEYDECVAGFEKIDAARGEQLISGDGEAVIYIGKAVCPFCRRFVKKLKKVAEETHAHIYYIDSADESDMEGITAFREKYSIPTVPGFIYTNGAAVNVRCDSSMIEEEIKAFMNK